MSVFLYSSSKLAESSCQDQYYNAIVLLPQLMHKLNFWNNSSVHASASALYGMWYCPQHTARVQHSVKQECLQLVRQCNTSNWLWKEPEVTTNIFEVHGYWWLGSSYGTLQTFPSLQVAISTQSYFIHGLILRGTQGITRALFLLNNTYCM